MIKTQEWFGSIISRPIDEESRMIPLSPSGEAMEREASDYILPSPTLAPYQRIELYNQQYWWRLLSAMQESFPFLTRLFGYKEFNRVIAKPYLVKYRPRHWTLNVLGDRLPLWIEEEYHEDDKALVQHAAELDYAFERSFFAAKYPTITLQDLADEEQFFNTPLYLQPHIALFSFPYDLLSCRRDILVHEPEHWEEQPFPDLPKGEFYFVLFRDFQNEMRWESVSSEEFQLLSLFKKGSSLNEVWEASKNLLNGLQQWVAFHWITHVSS